MSEDKKPVSTTGLNIYTCGQCRGHIVTRHVDDGTTPFMLGCRATNGCEGMMKSSLYRVFDQTMKASHEWYKPDAAEYAGLSEPAKHHVDKGGVMIRPSTER